MFPRKTVWAFQLLILILLISLVAAKAEKEKIPPSFPYLPTFQVTKSLGSDCQELLRSQRGKGWEVEIKDRGPWTGHARGQEEKEGLGMWHTDIYANREMKRYWGCRFLKWCRGQNGAEGITATIKVSALQAIGALHVRTYVTCTAHYWGTEGLSKLPMLVTSAKLALCHFVHQLPDRFFLLPSHMHSSLCHLPCRKDGSKQF